MQRVENVWTSRDRYSYMESVNFGQVKKFGDYGLLYLFAYFVGCKISARIILAWSTWRQIADESTD